MCFFHNDFEAFQIHLAEGSGAHASIYLLPVGLLVVSGEVFRTYANAVTLDAIDIGGCNLSCQ